MAKVVAMQRQKMKVPKRHMSGGQKAVDRFAETIQSITNKPGELIKLPKGELRIDRSYQRPINQRRVYRIANNWNWVACGVLVVSMRAQGYFVVDGQHRLEAAKLVNHVTDLPCIAFELAQIDEARGFLALNLEHQQPTMLERWGALLLAHDKAALAADGLMRRFDRSIGESSHHPRRIACIGLIHTLATDDFARLERLWPTIEAAHSLSETISANVVKGLWRIESRMPQGFTLAADRWTGRLKQIGLQMIIQSINQVAALEGKRGYPQCAEGILRAINRGIRQPLRVDVR